MVPGVSGTTSEAGVSVGMTVVGLLVAVGERGERVAWTVRGRRKGTSCAVGETVEGERVGRGVTLGRIVAVGRGEADGVIVGVMRGEPARVGIPTPISRGNSIA